jgi:hypothetical protein
VVLFKLPRISNKQAYGHSHVCELLLASILASFLLRLSSKRNAAALNDINIQ